MCFCLFLSLLLGSHTYGFDKRVDKQGYFNGKHWEIVTDWDKVEYSDEYVGLYVDGTPVFSCNNYTIDTVSIGKNLYFKVEKRKDNHEELYNMNGNRALSIEFDQIDPVHNLDGYYDFTLIEGESHKKYLCDLQLNIIKSGYVNAYGVSFDEGILEKGICVVYKRDEEYEVELYNLNWELVLPPFVSLTTKSDYYGNKYKFIKDSSGYIGRLDLNLNWIIPLDKHFTDIEDEKILGKKYYKCKNGGYWGLFDTKLNEVIAPDYEELEVFDGTNFIKFKLNGFWGVMALQGNKAKTIIPTTRGYTSISRYVKSQKRFTYEMNGYKGECDINGRQISKIRTSSTSDMKSNNANASQSSSSSTTNKPKTDINIYPYSYSYDSSSRSHVYKMDNAKTLEGEGLASIQLEMWKNSKGIQLILDLFETKSNSIIASWANKADRQGGTISGTGVTLNLSNRAKENVLFVLQDHRSESFKTNNYGLLYLFVPLSTSNNSSKLTNSLSTYDIKSITYDGKTFQIDVPTAATIKSMFEKIKVK